MVEIKIHFLADQKNWISIDLRGAQVKKKQFDIAILDFSKAFDTVPHDRLLGKLAFYGITGPVLNWTSAFLKNQEQRVVVGGEQFPYKLHELAYISLVCSTMEYCGAIWDTTVMEECDRLEIVQSWAARWARGAKCIISVVALLKDLDWLPLADRRRHKILCLFYKIINSEFQVPEHTVDIKRSKSRTR